MCLSTHTVRCSFCTATGVWLGVCVCVCHVSPISSLSSVTKPLKIDLGSLAAWLCLCQQPARLHAHLTMYLHSSVFMILYPLLVLYACLCVYKRFKSMALSQGCQTHFRWRATSSPL